MKDRLRLAAMDLEAAFESSWEPGAMHRTMYLGHALQYCNAVTRMCT